MVVYWSCDALLVRSDVPTLLECARYEGLRTVDASLFKIALLVGRLCSASWGEEISPVGPVVTDSFGGRAARSPPASMSAKPCGC